ncbi:flagellar FliJ protein [Methylomarinovum caldicuralii]|uniref:Flagellar FliJ protein n=1 Tax=Methylomarinovum caldicuralii TaxID=438856 RepID=A0AAU9C371_9GAMM|nr:flagellar export protein FliJ [Methylomarinovum caldicuralii]BCX81645.1 flagellar FliJ protein [Methylomarinovum caldicuralii]
MSRSQRLQPVKEFIRRQEDEVAKAMNRAAEELRQAQAQLEALQQFRRQYSGELPRQGGAVRGALLHEYRAFLANLGRAIQEQEEKLVRLRQQHAELERNWRQVHCRHRGVEKFQHKLERQEIHALERRLQNELDDRSASRFRKPKPK